MANRNFQNTQFTLDKGVVTLYAHVAIGGSGAATLQAFNYTSGTYGTASSLGVAGVKSVAKISTGVYEVTLQDSYVRLLDFAVVQSKATGLPTSCIVGLWDATNVRSATAPKVKFTLMSSSATAAEPANGDTLYIRITLQNSSVG